MRTPKTDLSQIERDMEWVGMVLVFNKDQYNYCAMISGFKLDEDRLAFSSKWVVKADSSVSPSLWEKVDDDISNILPIILTTQIKVIRSLSGDWLVIPRLDEYGIGTLFIKKEENITAQVKSVANT